MWMYTRAAMSSRIVRILYTIHISLVKKKCDFLWGDFHRKGARHKFLLFVYRELLGGVRDSSARFLWVNLRELFEHIISEIMNNFYL